MRNLASFAGVAAVAVAVTLSVSSITSRAAGTSYADDRAAIENLQARYLFAMDFHDPDLYVTTFTEDGILDVGSGEIKAAPTGSTTPTTTPSAAPCSTASATTRTSWCA